MRGSGMGDGMTNLSVHYSSETPEHYTPKHIIDAAIECMGAIDLDPCSNSIVTPNVPASMHYIKKDDGLSLPWRGRVYMNPPYGRGIGSWTYKLLMEYRAERTSQAVALLPGRIDTQWIRVLKDFPRCEIAGRLKFIGNTGPAPFPSVVYYLGHDFDSFHSAFRAHGDIWQRVWI